MSINTVTKIDGEVPITNVLVSVSNKAGLDILIPGLVAINSAVRFYSTGGTHEKIREILGKKAVTFSGLLRT